ncbi:HNH endonuclease [Nocardioides marmoriginsengisoli]
MDFAGSRIRDSLWTVGRTDERGYISSRLREAVYRRDGFACIQCGSTDELSLDHIHPWSLGGTDDFANLQTLCRSCNSRKGARI